MYEIKYYGTSSPRPEITQDGKFLQIDMAVERLNELQKLVDEAKEIISHEIDNGRMPTMLKGKVSHWS